MSEQKDMGFPAQRESAEESSWTGTVSDIVFRNEETGFTVFRLDTGRLDNLSVKGVFHCVERGDNVVCRGSVGTHAKYGAQLDAKSIAVVPPTSAAGIERLLASGRIDGIGKEFARRIVQAFGEETLKVLDEQPERLQGIKGIGAKKAKVITESWREHRASAKVMSWFLSFGFSPNKAYQVWKRYKNQTVEMVSENPYRLCGDIFGVGFRLADTIALNLGMNPEDPKRLRVGLRHTLVELSERGHCAQEVGALFREASKVLKLGKPALLSAALAEELAAKTLIQDGDFIYLPELHEAEGRVALRLSRLVRGNPPWAGKIDGGALSRAQEETGLKLSDNQRESLEGLLESKAGVLTGGPGTGKTTVLRVLLEVLYGKVPAMKLCAPTGRAAKRMSESTGKDASTIHRLLAYSPQEEGFTYNQQNPLTAGLVVIDESSMLDIRLAADLLDAIPDEAAVLFVGDSDQLPSVGPGSVLKDLVECGCLRHARLTEVFRQAGGSAIVEAAHRVNKGGFPDRSPQEGMKKDFYWMTPGQGEDFQKMVVDLVARRLPEHYHLDPLKDIQVLTTQHKGALGTIELNKSLQSRLNPVREDSENYVERFGVRYAVGDRVMQLRNDYDREVFNGDLGTVVTLNQAAKTLVVSMGGKEVIYTKDDLDDLVLAYAKTVHKSQGSEYRAVVIVLAEEHWTMLTRKIVYTAITRGRELVVLVSRPKALDMAVKRVDAGQRVSRLSHRVRRAIGEVVVG